MSARLDEARIRAVMRLREAGATVAEIQAALGLTERQVRHAMKQATQGNQGRQQHDD